MFTKRAVLLGLVAASAVLAEIFALQAPQGRGGVADPAIDRTSHRAAGPYESTRLVEPSLPDQTIYRPADLSGLGTAKLPVVAFGNGGCISNGGAGAEPFLTELAANGYLVGAGGVFPVASTPGVSAQAAPARAAGPAPLDRPAPGQTATVVLANFIDWAIRENSRTGSPYQGRIDTTKIALMGHSCGGLQAIALAADPRVSTVVVLNSGTISSMGIPTPDGGFRRPAGYVPSNENDLAGFHTPVLYLIGGPTDVAYAGSQADLKAIDRVFLFMGNYPVGHNATYREPRGGVFGAVALDWLDWQLKGNRGLARYFTGADCTLCSAANWTIERKNVP